MFLHSSCLLKMGDKRVGVLSLLLLLLLGMADWRRIKEETSFRGDEGGLGSSLRGGGGAGAGFKGGKDGVARGGFGVGGRGVGDGKNPSLKT